ncbi:hypothetical protein F5B19DRAFT_467538 [Rostrohypoxylon terebratum]|nr:hypothetical protein F5B19DRAFT_467538 [Rostrohypoxylon terebratum]
MGRLPPEIVQGILSCIGDFDTLKAAISTCRYLHTVFISQKKEIVTQVLVNRIGWDVLPESILAYETSLPGPYEPYMLGYDESSAPGPYEAQKTEEFFEKHLSRRMTSLPKSMRWDITEALSILHRHNMTESLTEGLVSRGLVNSTLNPDSKPRLLPSDIHKIQRGYYLSLTKMHVLIQPSSWVISDEQRDAFYRQLKRFSERAGDNFYRTSVGS